MNRKQRRDATKQKPSYLRTTKEDMMKRLCKNGITPDDLQKEYQKGYEAGFHDSGKPIMRTCYAAACLALNDLHRFSRKRCANVLKRLDWHVTNTLSSQEAIDEVYKRMGLHIDFDDPFERVQEVE